MSSFAQVMSPASLHQSQSFRRQAIERRSVIVELTVVCLWTVIGLALTVLAGGVGPELGQILAAAG
jgi:hypothetical protein